LDAVDTTDNNDSDKAKRLKASLTYLDSRFGDNNKKANSLFMNDFLDELYTTAPKRPDDKNERVYQVESDLNKSYRIENILENL
jgi:hypothetical protein